MTDVLDLFRAARPQMPEPSDDIRQPTGRNSNGVDLHQLAMVPGSPAYTARIPKPPCWTCGEDHFPGRGYDHAWQPEPVTVHDEPVTATAIHRAPGLVIDAASSTPPTRRVALYVGRNDTYVLAVEEPPDWDTVENFRVSSESVLDLVRLARALGVKVADKTGGDLFMLEEEDARQFTQAHGRGPAAAGDPGTRRSGPVADGAEEGEPTRAERTDGELPEPGGERQRPARRAQR